MRLWICAAALNGFLAVALGAHAAHSLRGRAEPEVVSWVDVGSDYGMAHALALLAVALLVRRTARPPRALTLAGWAFLAGTVLFSLVLYVMGVTGWRALGAVVPVGGLLFLAGWAALFVYGLGLRGASGGEASSRRASPSSAQHGSDSTSSPHRASAAGARIGHGPGAAAGADQAGTAQLGQVLRQRGLAEIEQTAELAERVRRVRTVTERDGAALVAHGLERDVGLPRRAPNRFGFPHGALPLPFGVRPQARRGSPGRGRLARLISPRTEA